MTDKKTTPFDRIRNYVRLDYNLTFDELMVSLAMLGVLHEPPEFADRKREQMRVVQQHLAAVAKSGQRGAAEGYWRELLSVLLYVKRYEHWRTHVQPTEVMTTGDWRMADHDAFMKEAYKRIRARRKTGLTKDVAGRHTEQP